MTQCPHALALAVTYSEISKADTEFCWFRTSGMWLTPQQQSGSQRGAGFSAHLSVGEYRQTTTKLIAKNTAIYIYEYIYSLQQYLSNYYSCKYLATQL